MTAQRSTSAGRRRPVLLGAAALGIAAVTGGFLVWQKSVNGPTRTADPAAMERRVERLMNDYERSTMALLSPGQTLPRLALKSISGHPEVRWDQPMLITFGSEFAPQVKALHARMGRAIQRVHVAYHPVQDFESPIDAKALSEFSADVAVLDAVTEATSDTRALLEQIGIHRAGYAFVLGKDRQIRYVSNVIGLDGSGVMNAVRAVSSAAAGAPVPASDLPLRAGQTLPLNAPALPGGALPDSLKAELQRKQAVVFFSSPACAVCTPWNDVSGPYVKRWKDAGYGVVFVQADQPAFRAETRPDGAWAVSDLKTEVPERSVLFRLWNVRTFPGAYILREGQFQGSVPFVAVKNEQGEFFDLQFLAVDRILKGNPETLGP